jgi:hypothetical protein
MIATPESPAATPASPVPSPAVSGSPLAQRALEALGSALQATTGEGRQAVEERNVYRPDSWLIQRCWEVLADAGATRECLRIAELAAPRQPLAPIQALYRLTQQREHHIGLAGEVSRELALQQGALLASTGRDAARRTEQLLYAAATAAMLDERTIAFALLERLDQQLQPWDRVMVQPEQRSMLAQTILRVGPYPLTIGLLTHALRRFSDAGAHLVLEVTTGASAQLRRAQGPPGSARLLAVGVDSFRLATLTSLHSRRLTATVYAQAGLLSEMLEQLTAIANIQAARRESGLSLRQGDPSLLRQVKRPTANADVDFQVYALREAVRALPVRQLTRDDRIELANRLAALGTRSDGWTAAGAASSLVELGAIKFGLEVVSNITESDPTRAEGVISLVRSLLTAGEITLAEEQVQKGLEWAQAYPGRNPERALIWGLADVYLERQEPEKALAILDQWREPAGFGVRMRNLFGRRMDDDQLRNGGLRLRARLQQPAATASEIQNQVKQLATWAPRLLEGEALVNFLVGDMLKPLLASGRTRQGLALLPIIGDALRFGSGEKHAVRVAAVANALTGEMTPAGEIDAAEVASNGHRHGTFAAETRAALEQFACGVWNNDEQRGLWQTVHGIEGTLQLVLALEGAEAVVAIAEGTSQLGKRWPD